MGFRYGVAALLLTAPLFSAASAQTIALDKEDATVWAQDQVISGTLSGAAGGTLEVGGASIPFTADAEGRFAVPLRLGPGETAVVACAAGGSVCTEPRRLTLGFTPRPEAELRATVAGRSVRLEGEVLENPSGGALTFAWAADPGNPAPLAVSASSDTEASVEVPAEAPPGEYTFAWTVRDAEGGERTARTLVTVHEDGSVTPFVLEDDHAAWVDRAVVYGIAPFYFVRNASNRLRAITEKLPELAELGVNTLWLQPIHPTVGTGQSYDVTDYFEVWSGFGTKEDLRDLVDTAHGLGMRVLLDLVPNHTALGHPYAQDAIEHGERSHYYDFYQRERDAAPYARHYNTRTVGAMTFVHYFWPDLPNLNYDNPEVHRHLIEASRYWVEEFGIDGYRVDVAWGPDARNPAFFPEWRAALKRIRPDLLLLGEDKATRPQVFDRRFDVAYDWAPGEGWVSQWNWQNTYSDNSNPTIFNNTPLTQRSSRLRAALTNGGQGWAPGARVLRFMENNDTFRFVQHHTDEQTRMVATLLFSLPGVPLMYMGQEVGFASHPYQTFTVYQSGSTIQSRDPQGRYFPFYQHLIRLRDTFPSLTSDTFEEVGVTPTSTAWRTFAYRRWAGEEHIVGAINMGDTNVQATLALPIAEMGLDLEETYYLTDLITGQATAHGGGELASLTLTVPAHTTLLFAVADRPLEIPVSSEPDARATPDALVVEGAYPNPFTEQATFAFRTGRPGHVRLRVLDLLGREVAVLVDEHRPAGRQQATLEGRGLASGVYVYVLEAEGERAAGRVTLVR